MSHFGEFFDILTGTHIRDPARAADGELYDFTTLSEWFDSREAEGLPIISPRTLEPMGRTLTRDATALARLSLVLEDLALSDPGLFIKTLKVLRAIFDILDPLGDLLNAVLRGFKVRGTATHPIRSAPYRTRSTPRPRLLTSTTRHLLRRPRPCSSSATSRAASPRCSTGSG